VQRAVEASSVSADETILIGDDERDLVAGRAAGVRVALVCTGKGERGRYQVQPDTLVFANLLVAAISIVGNEEEWPPKEP
jgi:phosphoglycolate phosphatase-like HAD superfamily hydrolase